jgi:hypothetical protein
VPLLSYQVDGKRKYLKLFIEYKTWGDDYGDAMKAQKMSEIRDQGDLQPH